LAEVLEAVRTLLVRMMAFIAAYAELRMAAPLPLLYGERRRATAMAVDARPASLEVSAARFATSADSWAKAEAPTIRKAQKNRGESLVCMSHSGIHGKHFGTGVEIHYAAADSNRQTIPWVEYRNQKTDEKSTFLADGSTAESVADLPHYQMQCVDCHNRPTHTFELPEQAVDKAMGMGRISPTLPFVKKTPIELLRASYSSNNEASRMIPAGLAHFHAQNNPSVSSERSKDIAAAGAEIAAIYNRNVFPELKVTWGTYPNNLGHTDFPGCFRCHDGSHSTSDKNVTITQDCSTCHELLATEEATPGVLKALGLTERIANIQKR
jgi:hypothetical protein